MRSNKVRGATREEVLAVLQANEEIGVREVAQRVGKPAFFVRHAIAALEREGRIVVHHPGLGYHVQRTVRLADAR